MTGKRVPPCAAVIIVIALLATAGPSRAADAPLPPATRKVAPAPRLGTNLSGPADWNTELPFIDVFRMARPWISQRTGQPWGKGPALALDPRGWVTKLEPDCFAETPLCTIEKGHYPSGLYTVLYDGEGKLDVVHAAKAVSREPGKMLIDVDSTKGGFFLQLRETNPQNPVRNIRILMPGFTAEAVAANPFHPKFLATWQGMACLRYMDWMHTNGSKVTTWADRPRLDDATWSAKGIPVEVMCDLSNRLKSDAWFCMPHLADDDYVRNFAKLVKDRLDPNLKAYVEYSNEVWNGQFQQSKYAGEEGKRLGFADKPWEAGWRYTAHRSVQIFKIWEEVFGGRDRLVRVIASQAGNAFVAKQILSFQDAHLQTDALAIAPYVSCNVPKQGKGLTSDVVEKWTVDQILDHVEQKSLPESAKWVRDHAKMAEQYNLRLIAYEGGQHMVGVAGGENSAPLTALFHAANAHPRMGRIYTQHLADWTAAGGDLFCHFSSTGAWSKWGSWGVLQFHDDDPAKSPKLQSLLRWAKQQGQNTLPPAP